MKKISCLVISLIFAVFVACNSPGNTQVQNEVKQELVDTTQWLISQAIKAHGSAQIDSHYIAFTFRNKAFLIERSQQGFSYRRTFSNDDGQIIQDVLEEDYFARTINGAQLSLSPKDSSGYANAVNSVVYFALLPYFLEDAAVQAEYKGVSTAFGKEYYELLITFSEENGGKDHDDQYAYWVNAATFTIDYLAYNFSVNGGGARFREAYANETIKGVRFQNYINYKPQEDFRDVLQLDDWFAAGKLDTLSQIDLENISLKKK